MGAGTWFMDHCVTRVGDNTGTRLGSYATLLFFPHTRSDLRHTLGGLRECRSTIVPRTICLGEGMEADSDDLRGRGGQALTRS